MSPPPPFAIVGPMLGHHPGWVPSQGEILARFGRADDWQVETASPHLGPIRRNVHTVASLAAWRCRLAAVVVMVFSGAAFWNALAATTTARRLGLPVVLWLHGGDLPRFAETHPRRASLLVRQAAAIVAPSPYLAKEFPSHDRPVEQIWNLLPLDDYHYRPRPDPAPRLLWMRTFHDLYQPEMALDVLAALVERHPAATLTMAGQDKGFEATMRNTAEALGLADRVSFPGFLGPEGKRRAFAEHDVFLNTNRVDNAPVSLLEAAAAGLPIVSTDVGGIPHLFGHGETALLVGSGDGSSMAREVTRLLEEPELAGGLSERGRALALRSTWPEVGPRWRELLERVASSATAPPES